MKIIQLLPLLALVSFSMESCKTISKIDKHSMESAMIKAMVWQEANPIQAKAPTDWTN